MGCSPDAEMPVPPLRLLCPPNPQLSTAGYQPVLRVNPLGRPRFIDTGIRRDILLFMAAKPIRDGFHTITPYLFTQNTPRLIQFLSAAFAGELISKMERPDGAIMHAEMRVGDSMLMLGEGTARFPPMPASIYLYVPDCDATWRQALAAGGSSVSSVRNLPSGERYGGVKDPCGNIWWIATHVEDVPSEEQARRWQAFQIANREDQGAK